MHILFIYNIIYKHQRDHPTYIALYNYNKQQSSKSLASIIDSREQGLATLLYCCIILYCIYWLCIRVRTDTLLSVIIWFLARPSKERFGEEGTVVEEQTTRGRSQSTANPQKDSSRSLKGYRVDRCWKKQTHTHIKALQGSIIDHFTLHGHKW